MPGLHLPWSALVGQGAQRKAPSLRSGSFNQPYASEMSLGPMCLDHSQDRQAVWFLAEPVRTELYRSVQGTGVQFQINVCLVRWPRYCITWNLAPSVPLHTWFPIFLNLQRGKWLNVGCRVSFLMDVDEGSRAFLEHDPLGGRRVLPCPGSQQCFKTNSFSWWNCDHETGPSRCLFSTEDDNTSFSCLPVRGRISSVIPAAVNPTGQLLRLCYFCFAFVLSVRVSVSKPRPASSSLCSSADLEHGPQSQAQEFWDCRPVLPSPAGLLFIPWFTECGTLGRSLPHLPGFCEHVPLCLLHRNY